MAYRDRNRDEPYNGDPTPVHYYFQRRKITRMLIKEHYTVIYFEIAFKDRSIASVYNIGVCLRFNKHY